jgi:hypothetical protein
VGLTGIICHVNHSLSTLQTSTVINAHYAMPLQIDRQPRITYHTARNLPNAPKWVHHPPFLSLFYHSSIHQGPDLCGSVIKSTPVDSIRRCRWRETLTRERFLARSRRPSMSAIAPTPHRPNNLHYYIAAVRCQCSERVI